MSNNNFLKIGLFNLEQDIKSFCEKGVSQIDTFQEKLEDKKKRIGESKDYPDKDKALQVLNRYIVNLKSIRERQIELYNWIDYLYKFGNDDVAVFIDNKNTEEKKKKKPKSKSKAQPKTTTPKKLTNKKTKLPK